MSDVQALDARRKALQRARLLLAKARSTPFPAEAETFRAGAQRLCERHGLTGEDLHRGSLVGPGEVEVQVERPAPAPPRASVAFVAALDDRLDGIPRPTEFSFGS